jgi:hypothetical protein
MGCWKHGWIKIDNPKISPNPTETPPKWENHGKPMIFPRKKVTNIDHHDKIMTHKTQFPRHPMLPHVAGEALWS